MHRIPLKIVTRLSVIFTVIGLLLCDHRYLHRNYDRIDNIRSRVSGTCWNDNFIAVFRRCPHCGSFLKTGCNRYCPHCGKYVDENDYIYF